MKIEKKRRNKKASIRKILVWAGVFCIVVAAALTGYNLWEDAHAGAQAERIVSALKEKRDAAAEKKGSFSPAVPTELPDYVKNPDTEMPVTEVDDFRYIGTLTILPLELELPVMDDWNYTRMRIAPCRYVGSAYLDNLVICGHNYKSHFRRLNRLQKNDEILFTDTAGNVFRYAVESIDELSATAIEEMTSSAYDLTLFTCTVSGRARVTVRCNRIRN